MKKGDWIFDRCDQIGKAKSDPYESCGLMQVDVIIYDRLGNRVGRSSPAMGGPTDFEPSCGAEDWVAIEKPRFPLSQYAYLTELLKVAASA